ncbi:MAG: hypothetical protein MHM6MM_003882 [Cercozoa sp. M6MM]
MSEHTKTHKEEAAQQPEEEAARQNDHEEGQVDQESPHEGDRPRKRRKKLRVSREEVEEFNRRERKKGVVYLPSLPPFMQPSRVRDLLGQHGTVTRVYLAPQEQKTAKKKTKRVHYTDGWVEFEHKKQAKRVAKMLNGQQIGGPRRSRFYYDTWNIKYLSGFKWSQLTARVAEESHERDLKVREAMREARREDQFFRTQAANERMIGDIKRRKRARGQQETEEKPLRQFAQRESRASDEGSASVVLRHLRDR